MNPLLRPRDSATIDLFGSPGGNGAERASRPEPAGGEERASACDYWDHCPNCGARLQNQKCTYRCPRCTYFMSCSDFD